MPIATINLLEGRDKETKKKLIKNVTLAIKESLAVQESTIRVIINELPSEHYGVAGLPVNEYRVKIANEKE